MLFLCRSHLRFTALFAILLLAALPSLAQQSTSSGSYTLQKHVRKVLTDVTVTDANGNPVTGLPQSAFRIYDNGHPQKIDFFAAHSGKDLAVASDSDASGVYSNRYLSHPPAVYNIALIDVTTMTLTVQMAFRLQFIRFLKELPPTVPLAIYARNGPHIVLVQNFTTSHDKLLAAVNRIIPRFRPVSFPYDNDRGIFKQMTRYLSQYPGRKNLLWFNGGSNLFLMDDAREILSVQGNIASGGSTSMTSHGQRVFLPQMRTKLPFTNSVDLRKLYEALEAERIAVYPIDVRGVLPSSDIALKDEHLTMSHEASTTGGKAYYDTNAVAQSALRILNHSAYFYTISYSPDDLQRRGRWHEVRVEVDGPYRLSYRRAYFDGKHQRAPRAKLLTASNGDKVKPPDFRSDPILFQASITPATAPAAHKAPRGTQPYLIHYVLPITPFPAAPLDAQNFKLTMGVDAVILDNNGGVRSERKRLVVLSIPAAAWQHPDNSQFVWQQTLDLPKGQNEIYLSVWNPDTGRLGTLQIPLNIQKH